MKNLTFTGIMASILMTTGAAFAAGEVELATLTTKGYVDAGLKAVYKTAAAAASAASTNASNIATNSAAIAANASSITTLQGTVGDHTTSIATNAENIAANASSITTLQGTVGDHTTSIATNAENIAANASSIAALQTTVDGLDGAAYSGVNGVTVSDHNVGLNVTATGNNMYVYTASGWAALPVEDTWNSSILTAED